MLSKLNIPEVLQIAIVPAIQQYTKKIKINPGVYSLNDQVSFHIQGELSKDEDEQYRPTVKIPLIMTLALCLEKAGIMRETARRLIQEAMLEALENQNNPNESLMERIRDTETALRTVHELLLQLPEETRSGKTKFKGIIETIKFPVK